MTGPHSAASNLGGVPPPTPEAELEVNMTGASKKRDQPQSAASQLDRGPPPTSESEQEAPKSQEHDNASTVVYKRKRQKLVTNRGKRPADSETNSDEPIREANEADVMQEEEPKKKRRKVTENEGPRNRSSPARLFKLNKGLQRDQKTVIRDIEFGGLLDITATSMPGDLSQWIMKHYDPEMSQIVIPDRGKIPVDAESVRRIWGLPNRGRKVCFEMNPDVIREFNNIYKIKGKNAPTLTSWCKMIENMDGSSDDKFLRAWLAVAFSCFLAPTTSLSISPRCYTAIMHTDVIKDTKICDFVVDQLRLAFMGFGDKKKAVCCCVFHLVILYLDSLDVDEPIPATLPRAPIWNDDLISRVVKKDKKGPGLYGKLRLKTEFSRCAEDSLFGSLEHVSKFVAAKLPKNYDINKQKKITGMVHEMCTEMSHAVGKLVLGLGKLDEEEPGPSKSVDNTTRASEHHTSRRKRATPRVPDHTSTEDEDSFKSDEEEEDEDDSDYKEEESDSDDLRDGSEDDDPDDDDDSHQGGTASQRNVDADVDDDSEDGEETQEGTENKDGSAKGDDNTQGGDDSDPQAEEGEENKLDAQGNHKAKDDEIENEDEDENCQEEECGKKNDYGDGDDEEQGGGGNAGVCNQRNNSDGDEQGASSDSSKDDGSASNFFINPRDSKPRGGDDAETFSLADMVRWEFKKQWDPFKMKLDVPKVFDGRKTESYTSMLFQQVLLHGEDKQLGIEFNSEELCPPKTQNDLMEAICGIKQSETKAKQSSGKVLPPVPPSKQKRVSFNLDPIPVAATEQRMGTRVLISSLKHKGKHEKVLQAVEMASEARQVSCGATSKEEQAAQIRIQAERPIAVAINGNEVVGPGKQTVPANKLPNPVVELPSHITKLPERGPQLASSAMTGSKQSVSANKLPGNIVNLPTRVHQLASSSMTCTKQTVPASKLPSHVVNLPERGPQLASLPGTAGKQTMPASKLPSHAVNLPEGGPQLASLPGTAGKQTVPAFNLPSHVVNLPERGPQLASLPGTAGKQTVPASKLPNHVVNLPKRSHQVASLPGTAGKQIVLASKLPSHAVNLPEGGPQLASLPGTAGKQTVPAEKLHTTDVRHAGPVGKLLKTNLMLPTMSLNDADKENRPLLQHNENCPPLQHKEQTAQIIFQETAKGLYNTSASGVWDEYCPVPSFGLILDELDTCLEDANNDMKHGQNALDTRTKDVVTTSMTEVINLEDDGWDLEEIETACVEAERRSKESAGKQADHNLSSSNFSTPEKVFTEIDAGSGGKFSSSSSSGELVTNQFERRLIKPSACLRSPFLDLDYKKIFNCSPAVNRLYASVILHARLSAEESMEIDISPKVIDYNGYFVSLRELADSMKVGGFVLSHVFEVGIESIMQNLPPDSRKVVMPLRFSIRLQQMVWNTQEISNKFNKSKRLDRKDMIMFPILENLDPAKPRTGNHYWVFNLNIRDKRFEVLDSWRTLDDPVLNQNARLIAATVRSLWEHHYANSCVVLDKYPLVNIDVPRQDNDFDCGIYGLTNTSKWVARAVPNYEPSDIPNIRKQLTSTWVSTPQNIAPWKDILKLV